MPVASSSTARLRAVMTVPTLTSTYSWSCRSSVVVTTPPSAYSMSFATARFRLTSRWSIRRTSTKKQASLVPFARPCAKGESLSPRDRTNIARRWRRADEDLALAKHSDADADMVARGACVWAHQAAEKALNAVLLLRAIDPPKLHDLDRLAPRLLDDEGTSLHERVSPRPLLARRPHR
jgi:HEPN domain